MLPQIIFKIQQQFAKTGSGHTGKLQFCFLRSRRGKTSFRNILNAAARRLHHLIMSP
jgi:hypothetical protein